MNRRHHRHPLLAAAALCAAILAAAWPAVGPAAERPALPARLSLQEAMRIAFDQSTSLRVAAARLGQAEARAEESRAPLLPQVSLNAFQSDQIINLRAQGLDLPILPAKVGPFPSLDARVVVTEDIVNIASWNRRRTARERVVTAQEQQRNAREALALGVAGAYLQALRAQASAATLAEQVELAAKLEETTRSRYQVAVASRLELNRAEQQVNNLRQVLEEARQALTNAKLQLAYLIHAQVTADYELEAVEDRAAAFSKEEALRIARESRPDYRAAQSQARAAELQVKAVEATRLPTFQFQGDWGQSGRTPNDNFSTYRVRGVLSMPLFTGGRIRAEVSEAERQLEEARAALDDVEAQVEAEVLSALAGVESARRQVQVSEQNLRLARQELELATDRFTSGVADNTEVVNAQDRISRAEDARIRAVHNLRVAEANLFRATGAAEKTYRQ